MVGVEEKDKDEDEDERSQPLHDRFVTSGDIKIDGFRGDNAQQLHTPWSSSHPEHFINIGT